MGGGASRNGLTGTYEYVEGWGMAVGGLAKVHRPTSVEAIRALFVRARAERVPLALRGSGNSYGDASCSAGGIVVDVSRMNRLLAFDEKTGVATCEPGVTIEQLWKHIVPKGYWPRVVS